MKGANNPGNIRAGGGKFIGEVTPAGDAFRSFVDLAHGYRAIGKIFHAYYKKGYTTLEKALNRYAPPSDNNPTDNYIDYVAGKIKHPRNADLKPILFDPKRLSELIAAVSKFEQGSKFSNDLAALSSASGLIFGYSLSPVNNKSTGGAIASLAILAIFAAVVSR